MVTSVSLHSALIAAPYMVVSYLKVNVQGP